MAGANLNWCVCTHTSNMQQSWIYPWFDLDKWHEQPFHFVVAIFHECLRPQPPFKLGSTPNPHHLFCYGAYVLICDFRSSPANIGTENPQNSWITSSWAKSSKIRIMSHLEPPFSNFNSPIPDDLAGEIAIFMVESVESSESAVQMGLLEGLGRFQRAWPAASQKMDV